MPWSGVKITMGRSFFAVALAGLLLTGQAWSQECSLSIDGNDQIQFNKKELRVSKSCKEVTVTLKHVGQLAATVMGHNFVLTLFAGRRRSRHRVHGRDRRRSRNLREDRHVQVDGRRRLHLLLLVPWTLRVDEREIHHRIETEIKPAAAGFITWVQRHRSLAKALGGV